MKYQIRHKDSPLICYESETAGEMYWYIIDVLNLPESWVVIENGKEWNAEVWKNNFKLELD